MIHTRLIAIFIFSFLLGLKIHGQVFIHQPHVYYEYPYIETNEGCYYYNLEMDSSLINYNKEFEGYIDIKVFDLPGNMLYFERDEDGFYFCAYDRYNTTRMRGKSPIGDFPYEGIPLITSFDEDIQDELIDVQMEFRVGDLINTNGKIKILCPYYISSEVIKELNSKLIAEGYLSNKKRGKFQGKIRDAMYDFQEDNGISLGFIDQKTIDALKLDIIIDTR